jgi:hypothetical protein
MESQTQDVDVRGVFAALTFLAISITLTLLFGLSSGS